MINYVMLERIKRLYNKGVKLHKIVQIVKATCTVFNLKMWIENTVSCRRFECLTMTEQEIIERLDFSICTDKDAIIAMHIEGATIDYIVQILQIERVKVRRTINDFKRNFVNDEYDPHELDEDIQCFFDCAKKDDKLTYHARLEHFAHGWGSYQHLFKYKVEREIKKNA